MAADLAADDLGHMRQALAAAALAAAAGEVPVGAVVVHGAGRHARVVARAHNQCERLPDPTAHAERLAIGAAAAALGSWRLVDCTLFVTLEPCMMCAGAIALARLGRVVFAAHARAGEDGAPRPPWGRGGWLEHAGPAAGPQLTGGLLAGQSEALLATFFAARRPRGAPPAR